MLSFMVFFTQASSEATTGSGGPTLFEFGTVVSIAIVALGVFLIFRSRKKEKDAAFVRQVLAEREAAKKKDAAKSQTQDSGKGQTQGSGKKKSGSGKSRKKKK